MVGAGEAEVPGGADKQVAAPGRGSRLMYGRFVASNNELSF